ncbi:hypothetical protein CC86DRAFT_366867 [Ophiobolus disseminans]|uniref:Uncharacterized protein n=1 Tax=Ophiobolus disseminans TaxID=1469910 RepID=A0A6A7AFL7_9PLEO|nr:hypothetical protein CC86DRAFT_366867 [Ophiobolus disseminans]
MAKQPGYQISSYKLFGSAFALLSELHRGPLRQWPKDEREARYAAFRAGFESLEDELADAKKNGKHAFIKEHTIFTFGPDKLFAGLYGSDDGVEPLLLQQRDEPKSAHTNPSSLPDKILLSLQPIFQIRHPALMFPSMVRAQSRVLPDSNTRNPRVFSTLTLRHSRAVFDWYLEHGGDLKPKVIDADDIMNEPAVVRQLCIETGLDPDAIQYEWEERQEENALKASFLSTIITSKGIVKGLDARGLDIEAEKVKWKAEFGDDTGEGLAKFVYDAMPDYEYLLSHRTRAKVA